jgi:hypothetical protein
MRIRLKSLESEVEKLRKLKRDATEACAKIERNQPLSKAEAAAYLGISEKTLRRREMEGIVRRCPGYGARVMFAARDVLRLASAR